MAVPRAQLIIRVAQAINICEMSRTYLQLSNLVMSRTQLEYVEYNTYPILLPSGR